MAGMRRRDFIAAAGSTAVAWPLVAGAQHAAMPVVGFLDPRSPDALADRLRGFRQGLKDAGFVEGQNASIEYRWAENRMERLPELAADLVRRQVVVIVTPGGLASALAAKAATTTIPIVLVVADDPVRLACPLRFRPGVDRAHKGRQAACARGDDHDALGGAARYPEPKPLPLGLRGELLGGSRRA
jgi:ABC-type uncharacterized transport system substrate-binding protein